MQFTQNSSSRTTCRSEKKSNQQPKSTISPEVKTKYWDRSVSSSVFHKVSISLVCCHDGPLTACSEKRTDFRAAKYFVLSGVSMTWSSGLHAFLRDRWKIHLFIFLLVASSLLPPLSTRKGIYSRGRIYFCKRTGTDQNIDKPLSDRHVWMCAGSVTQNKREDEELRWKCNPV